MTFFFMIYPFESEKLITWFEKNRRDLPWRQCNDPYAVWVSEIMLQQTQVSSVIPYFARWMRRFPTLEALAAASLEEVMKLWEGLGYYSRARALHGGAKEIVEKHGGVVPGEPDKLMQIKGLGPYTVGAICSFAFHRKMAAVDGNAIRVLTRYFNLQEDVAKTSTQKKLRQIAEEILPDDKHWVFNEGLIELGATVCQRKPLCSKCPLHNTCHSFRLGNQASLPFKSGRLQTEKIARAVLIIRWEEQVLIKKVEEGVMSGLYEFPYTEWSENVQFPPDLHFIRWLPEEKHSFTKYRATLYPALLNAAQRMDREGYEWVTLEEALMRPFSSGHRKILNRLTKDVSPCFLD